MCLNVDLNQNQPVRQFNTLIYPISPYQNSQLQYNLIKIRFSTPIPTSPIDLMASPSSCHFTHPGISEFHVIYIHKKGIFLSRTGFLLSKSKFHIQGVKECSQIVLESWHLIGSKKHSPIIWVVKVAQETTLHNLLCRFPRSLTQRGITVK